MWTKTMILFVERGSSEYYMVLLRIVHWKVLLWQGSSNLAHEIHFPAEFSSNLNQTHLSMLIRVFKIIRKSQVGEFDQGWS